MEAIKKYLILSLMALLGIGGLYFSSAKSLSPVIPLDIELRDLPMVDLTLRDPKISSRAIKDEMALKSEIESAKSLELRLKKAKSASQKKQVLKQLYVVNGRLFFYYADVKAKRIDTIKSYKNINKIIAIHKAKFKKYSNAYAKMETVKTKKAAALYQSLSQSYTDRATVSQLKSLQSIQKFLPKYLKRRVAFITAYHNTRFVKGTKYAPSLEKVSRGMSRVHQIVANLTLSQKYAGLNSVGKKIAKTKLAYKRYLTRALSKAKVLPKQERKSVLSFAMGIWRKSVGIKQTYAQIPFSLAGYKDFRSVSAIQERIALENMSKDKYRNSAAIYRSLAAKYDGETLGVRLDKRIVDVEYLRFKKKKSIESYEKSLISMKNKYSDIENFDKQAKPSAASLKKALDFKYKTLVDSLLLASSKKATKKSIVKRSINVAKRYASANDNKIEKERVYSSVARIYQIHGKHRQAVNEYMKLVEYTKGERSQGYLVRAIQSQSKLAYWSEKVNWSKTALGGRLDRTELAEMYKLRLAHTKAWSDAAHLGLLLSDVGQRSKAFAIWQKQLTVSAQGPHAQRATGTMLFAYNKIGKWDELEKLAKLAIKKKVSPIHKDSLISPTKMLAEGLYNGAKENYASSNFEKAASKFKEFTKLFKQDKRRPEAMYLMAKSFHKTGEYMAAVDAMFEISKIYKSTKYHKPSLLLGGNWSVTMALENKAIYFYESFTMLYKDDSKVLSVRDTLAEIYLGRGLYGDAARAYLAQANDKRLSDQARVNYAAKHLNIEKVYGDPEKAKVSISIIDNLANKGSDAEMAKKIYALELAAKNKNYDELAKHEKQFSQMDIMDTDSREALALARYTLAKHKGEESFEEIFNLGLRNPRKALDDQIAHYESIKKTYESICEIEPNSFCAPAMFELAKLTERALYAIEDIKLPETLGDSTVKKFNAHKSNVVMKLVNEQNTADIQADGRSRGGETTPDWSSAILWSVSDDWSYSQTREDSGFGYVQWKPIKAN